MYFVIVGIKVIVFLLLSVVMYNGLSLFSSFVGTGIGIQLEFSGVGAYMINEIGVFEALHEFVAGLVSIMIIKYSTRVFEGVDV